MMMMIYVWPRRGNLIHFVCIFFPFTRWHDTMRTNDRTKRCGKVERKLFSIVVVGVKDDEMINKHFMSMPLLAFIIHFSTGFPSLSLKWTRDSSVRGTADSHINYSRVLAMMLFCWHDDTRATNSTCTTLMQSWCENYIMWNFIV